MQTNEVSSYFAKICVLLRQPIRSDDGEMIRGYFLNLGISSTADNLRGDLERAIDEGDIDWTDTSWEIRSLVECDEAIRRRSKPTEYGVWYRSGKAFYV
jgi:hypothetical protein